MPGPTTVEVHLLPELVAADHLRGGLVVVVDVLRATTTFVHALAAGCSRILPVADVESARRLALASPEDEWFLCGERDGASISGFDLGNSPDDFTATICHNKTAIATTTNGTRAILHALRGRRILLGAFVNFSAICSEIYDDPGPLHLLCAGRSGRVALEDALFAGAVVDFLMHRNAPRLNDSARLAWDAFEHHGQVLVSALELSEAGRHLLSLGFDGDVKAAAAVDRFALAPVVSGDPPVVTPGKVHLECRYYSGETGLMS